jgi:cobalt-zinc-cadmium efflux system protein
LELEDVQDVHDVHLWSLDGTYTVFSAHFVIDKDLSIVELERIKGDARRTLHEMGIHHTTIEFEASDNACEECDLE